MQAPKTKNYMMNYLFKTQLTILAVIFCFYITPQNTKGQTMYKSEPGYYMGFSNLNIGSRSLNPFQIGFVSGYRYNSNWDTDITLDFRHESGSIYELTLLNTGVTTGYTFQRLTAANLKWRQALSVFHTIPLSRSDEITEPLSNTSVTYESILMQPVTSLNDFGLYLFGQLKAGYGFSDDVLVANTLINQYRGFSSGPGIGTVIGRTFPFFSSHLSLGLNYLYREDIDEWGAQVEYSLRINF